MLDTAPTQHQRFSIPSLAILYPYPQALEQSMRTAIGWGRVAKGNIPIRIHVFCEVISAVPQYLPGLLLILKLLHDLRLPDDQKSQVIRYLGSCRNFGINPVPGTHIIESPIVYFTYTSHIESPIPLFYLHIPTYNPLKSISPTYPYTKSPIAYFPYIPLHIIPSSLFPLHTPTYNPL